MHGRKLVYVCKPRYLRATALLTAPYLDKNAYREPMSQTHVVDMGLLSGHCDTCEAPTNSVLCHRCSDLMSLCIRLREYPVSLQPWYCVWDRVKSAYDKKIIDVRSDLTGLVKVPGSSCIPSDSGYGSAADSCASPKSENSECSPPSFVEWLNRGEDLIYMW